MSADINLGDLALKVVAFGVGGWVLENVLFGDRYSAAWGGAKVPFLPVYALGGAAVTLVAPQLKAMGVALPVRGAVYAAALTGIEFVGCQIDRTAFKACSWDYSSKGCKSPAEGCVDVSHAALWGALGLLVEQL